MNVTGIAGEYFYRYLLYVSRALNDLALTWCVCRVELSEFWKAFIACHRMVHYSTPDHHRIPFMKVNSR